MCVCVQVRECMYVNVVVAAACLAVLARAVKLSVAMLPRPVERQRKSFVKIGRTHPCASDISWQAHGPEETQGPQSNLSRGGRNF